MKKNKIYIMTLFMVSLASTLSLTSCEQNETDYVEIIDCAGEKVTLSKEINRIISVDQSFSAFLVAMGMTEKLVGVHGSVLAHAWTPTFIGDISLIERFGYKPAAEKIYSENIDLVVLNDAAYAQSLRDVGIPAIYFGYTNIDELYYAVNLMGDILGKSAKTYAKKWESYVKETITSIKSDLSILKDNEKKNVYYINGEVSPGDIYKTFGGNSFTEYWVNTIGANFVTSKYQDITSLEQEVALSLNPDTIIISGYAEYKRQEELMEDPLWADIDAVKNNEVYLLPTSLVSFGKFSVELPMMLRYSANILYPSLYKFDAMPEMTKFYQDYYGKTFTEELIQNMLLGLGPDGSRMD